MSLQAVPGSIQQKLLVTRLLAMSLAGGLLVFLAVAVLATQGRSGSDTGSAVPLTTLAAVLWTVTLVLSFVLFQRRASPFALARHALGRDDEAALHAIHLPLQSACLIRWALLEGSALFAAVVLFLHRVDVRAQPVLLVDLLMVLISATLILLTVPGEATLRELVRLARRATATAPRR